MTKKTKKILLWSIIIVVLVAAAATGAYFWNKKAKEAADKKEAEEKANTAVKTANNPAEAPSNTKTTMQTIVESTGLVKEKTATA